MRVLPSLSAFQLAAARMGWALQDCDCLSVHGRPGRPPARGALSRRAPPCPDRVDGDTPRRSPTSSPTRAYGQTKLSVLEHLGGEKERIVHGTPKPGRNRSRSFTRWRSRLPPISASRPRARTFRAFPTMPFRHDGKMTKQDIRAVTLAELAPLPGRPTLGHRRRLRIGRHRMAARGSGRKGNRVWNPTRSGARWRPRTRPRSEFPHLELMDASAPEGLTDLPAPDAIFIGGGLTADEDRRGLHLRCPRRPAGRKRCHA
jgi:precorrin-6Y C5,15-methyltransferase (decarboxylating)